MQLKTLMDCIISCLLKWLLSKKTRNNKCWRRCREEERNLCALLVGIHIVAVDDKTSASLYTDAKLNLRDRVLDKVEENSFIALPGKEEHSRLLFWKTMCPNLVRTVRSFIVIIQIMKSLWTFFWWVGGEVSRSQHHQLQVPTGLGSISLWAAYHP